MLPTNEANPNLFIHQGLGNKEKILSSGQGMLHHKEMMACGVSKPQHLYITVNRKEDDESTWIKEGDWFIQWTKSNPDKYEVLQATKDNVDSYTKYKNLCKKIIATTDRNLILCRNSDHDGIPCNCVKVPQIPEAFIKKFVESQGKIISVLVEYEEY